VNLKDPVRWPALRGLMVDAGRDGQRSAAMWGRRGLELEPGFETGGGRQRFDFRKANGTATSHVVRDLARASPKSKHRGGWSSGGLGRMWRSYLLHSEQTPSPCFRRRADRTNSGVRLLRRCAGARSAQAPASGAVALLGRAAGITGFKPPPGRL